MSEASSPPRAHASDLLPPFPPLSPHPPSPRAAKVRLARELAERRGLVPTVFLVSALTGEGVHDAFNGVVAAAHQARAVPHHQIPWREEAKARDNINLTISRNIF